MKLKVTGLLALLIVLPNCIFKKSSRNYDCARAAYENILFKYERDMALFESINKAKEREEKLRLAHELRDEILLKNEEYNDEHSGLFDRKNEHANYPFTQYKKALDCNINLLEKTKTQLYWKQEGLGKSFQDLINTLDQLRKYVVLHEEYSRERNMMERRKILAVEKKEHAQKEQAKQQVRKKTNKRNNKKQN